MDSIHGNLLPKHLVPLWIYAQIRVNRQKPPLRWIRKKWREGFFWMLDHTFRAAIQIDGIWAAFCATVSPDKIFVVHNTD